MSLPANLIEEIRKVGATQEVDVDEALRSLGVLVGPDECVSYRVWGGPGFGQEAVLLDVYFLGKYALYNYTVLQAHVSGTCYFLDSIAAVSVVAVPDARSPYVLTLCGANKEEISRVFGGSKDLQGLERFRADIVSRRIRNMEDRHAHLPN